MKQLLGFQRTFSALFFSSLICATGGVIAEQKPNIIFLLTDDQGYGDLACHGHPLLKTPNLDKLHGQSIRFTDHQVSPTCAPTRAALMSGKDPFRVGITHTILERERMDLKTTTVANILQDAGYETGIFGKWHLGDDDAYQPEKRGFDEVFIHGAGGIGQNYAGTQGAVPGTSYFNPIIKHNGVFEQTKGYCTDVFFKQAMGWMKSCADQKKPFFAYIPTNAPHGPFIVSDAYKKPYLNKKVGGKKLDSATSAFYGMITNIDDNMGILLEKMDKWGLSDNTILVFMTDNGSARGARFFNAGMKGAKGSVDEGGSRVPFFVRLPKSKQAGLEIDTMTRHFDILPTLTEIAGGKLPKNEKFNGRSLWPLINGEKKEWENRTTYFHSGRWAKKGAPGRWGKGDTNPDNHKYGKFAVRTEQWRLVGKDELYDIQKDLGQKKNVIAAHPEVAARLLKEYGAWWDRVRPLMTNEDAPLDTGKPFIEQFNKQKADQGIPAWKEPKL